VDEISQIAVLAGLIVQAGAWYRYMNADTGELYKQKNGEEMKWNGRAKFVDYLRANPDFLEELENKLRGVQVEVEPGAAVDQDGYGEEQEGY
jgi:hypothetical protein